MKWIDESKGKLDYILASIPFFTLIFLVLAYFHTVHPYFTKTEELELLRAKVAELEDALVKKERETVEAILVNSELRGSLEEAQQRIDHLVARFGKDIPQEQIEEALEYRYYSIQAAIGSYLEYEGSILEQAFGGREAVRVQTIELDDAQRSFHFVIHQAYCGSGGCTGPLISEEYGAYCFVGWIHSKVLSALKSELDLPCRSIRGSERIWVSELIGWQPNE